MLHIIALQYINQAGHQPPGECFDPHLSEYSQSACYWIKYTNRKTTPLGMIRDKLMGDLNFHLACYLIESMPHERKASSMQSPPLHSSQCSPIRCSTC